MINICGVHLADEVSLKGIREIVFPKQDESVLHVAVDIGGSLAKVVYFTKDPESGGRLNFIKFESENIEECLEFIKSLLSPKPNQILFATGGGASKYNDLIAEKLHVKMIKYDEMDCLVKGIDFLVRNVPNEIFMFEETPKFVDSTDSYPYMLVNIGSGVSIIKVTSENTYERVSGTSLGGGTFWGLLSLFTDGSFEDMLKLSMEGDNTMVDMLVGDIYGKDYSKIGLKSNVIASSLGKIFKKSIKERQNIEGKDIARSLLYMISNNVGQIAYLNAKAHGISRIYFGGYFICGHSITMNALSYAIKFWSKGSISALFLRHEGFVGAVGAFMQ